MTRGLAISLEVELLVTQGPAQFGEGGLGVVVGIAVLQQLVYLRQPPPSAFASLGLAEGLTNHLHQIVQFLIRLILLDQRRNLLIIKPEALTRIKEVKGLGEELTMLEIVLEVDVAIHAHTDKSARARRIHQRLLLVGGTYKRGIAAELPDSLAVRRAELHFG